MRPSSDAKRFARLRAAKSLGNAESPDFCCEVARLLLQHRVRLRIAAGLLLAVLLSSAPTMAQNAQDTQPAAAPGGPTAAQAGTGAPPQAASPGSPPGLWERANLLGDMGGVRTALGTYGISVSLQNSAELFANATGGIKRRATASPHSPSTWTRRRRSGGTVEQSTSACSASTVRISARVIWGTSRPPAESLPLQLCGFGSFGISRPSSGSGLR